MYIHSKNKRILALCICVLFIASLVLSMTYIVKEANHEHVGSHCPICAQVLSMQRAIDQVGQALAFLFGIGLTVFIPCTAALRLYSVVVLSTPVRENVRMNN